MAVNNDPSHSDIENTPSGGFKAQLEDFFTGVPKPWFQVFFPALSILFITLAVYLSIYTGKSQAQDTLVNIAHQALRANNLSQIEKVLEKLIIVKGLNQEQVLGNYRNLISIVRDLKQQNIANAVTKIESMSPASFRGLVSGNKETSVIYNKIQQDFNTLVTEYKKFEKDHKDAPQKIEQILKQVNRHLVDINNLSYEYAGLFGLAPAKNGRVTFDEKTNKLIIDKVEIYKHGILAGLPHLKSLPDGLMTRVELRNTLDQLGGKINLSGTNLATEFEDRLKRFKQEFGQLNRTVLTLESQYLQMQRFENSNSFETPDYIHRLNTNIALLIVKSLQN